MALKNSIRCYSVQKLYQVIEDCSIFINTRKYKILFSNIIAETITDVNIKQFIQIVRTAS